ncbi:MAG: CPBP family intramembrane glutamate endopeptidase [Novosphingobium sp.]
MTAEPLAPGPRAMLRDFIQFLRRPQVLVPSGLRSAQGWRRWGWLTGLLIAGLIGIALPFITLWQKSFDLPSADAFAQYPKAWLVPTVALIAPVIEELLFRGWQRGSASALWLLACALAAIAAVLTLTAPGQALIVGVLFLALLVAAPLGWWLLRRRSAPLGWFAAAFPWIFYLVAGAFAAVHLSNYPSASLIALPMVLPQLWAALVLGHIRQKVGLVGSILAHASANSCTLALAMIGS